MNAFLLTAPFLCPSLLKLCPVAATSMTIRVFKASRELQTAHQHVSSPVAPTAMSGVMLSLLLPPFLAWPLGGKATWLTTQPCV